MQDVGNAFVELALADEDEEEDQKSDDLSEGEESEGENDDTANEDSSQEQTRKRKNESPKSNYRQARRQKRRNEQIVNSYYADGTFFGLCASSIMYTLASQLNKANDDFLWMGIIGGCCSLW